MNQSMHTLLLTTAPITFQHTIQSATNILHFEVFLAVLLHTENVKQLFCTIVRSLTMGEWGPKRVGPGVL